MRNVKTPVVNKIQAENNNCIGSLIEELFS